MHIKNESYYQEKTKNQNPENYDLVSMTMTDTYSRA